MQESWYCVQVKVFLFVVYLASYNLDIFHSCMPSPRLLSRSWVKVKRHSQLCKGQKQSLCHSAWRCCLARYVLIVFCVIPTVQVKPISQAAITSYVQTLLRNRTTVNKLLVTIAEGDLQQTNTLFQVLADGLNLATAYSIISTYFSRSITGFVVNQSINQSTSQ